MQEQIKKYCQKIINEHGLISIGGISQINFGVDMDLLKSFVKPDFEIKSPARADTQRMERDAEFDMIVSSFK